MTVPGAMLPNGLLIILHLHLLDYPLHDATGYDERLFDPTRGMRERNRAMEDIAYFLVGKIERSKERAKSILPTYPCLQPSDMTAFRIALAKYVEAIRNGIVHTTHAVEKPPEQKGKQPASSPRDEALAPTAWWWKDVVVRKSILDECCGERFERLILALSSHAILKNTAQAPSTLHPLSVQDHAILNALSKAYTARLAAAQNERLQWERSAALLIQRHADLVAIRARLADPRHASSSKYDALDTARLLAQRDSRLQDLRRGTWQSDEGRRALQLVTSLAGLVDPSPTSTRTPVSAVEEARSDPLSRADHQSQAPVPAEAPPLPIAAARHPSHLHALSAPLFPAQKASSSSQSEQHGSPSALPHAIAERIAAVQDVQHSLQEALQAAQGIHAQLQRRLLKAKERTAILAGRKIALDARLWAPRAGAGVVFKSPEDAAPLFEQFGLEAAASETAVEDRIAHIRTAILPPFVIEPLPEPEPEPEALRPATRIPQPQSRGQPPKAASHQPAYTQHAKVHPGKAQPRAHLADVPPAKTTQRDQKARAVSRRLSRRASAARTRRSTMFGRGEDAEILRIVASIEDRSDSEDEDKIVEERGLTQPRTPARWQQQLGTRGTLLSSVMKSAPRQSYDIDVHERAAHVPRLPSLRLSGAPELDEEDEEDEADGLGSIEQGVGDGNGDDDEGEGGEVYEGNSMTLADILLHAGNQGNTSLQLLGEELEDEMSDWE